MSGRRQFLRSLSSCVGGGWAFAPFLVLDRAMAKEIRQAASATAFQVASIERTTVKLDYRKIPARAMARELPHWRYGEICEVTLKSGQRGFGETMLYYTWGITDDQDVRRAIGRNAVEVMRDDSLGARDRRRDPSRAR